MALNLQSSCLSFPSVEVIVGVTLPDLDQNGMLDSSKLRVVFRNWISTSVRVRVRVCQRDVETQGRGKERIIRLFLP